VGSQIPDHDPEPLSIHVHNTAVPFRNRSASGLAYGVSTWLHSPQWHPLGRPTAAHSRPAPACSARLNSRTQTKGNMLALGRMRATALPSERAAVYVAPNAWVFTRDHTSVREGSVPPRRFEPLLGRSSRTCTERSPPSPRPNVPHPQLLPKRSNPKSAPPCATLTPAAMLSPRPTRATTQQPRRRTQKHNAQPIPKAALPPQRPFPHPPSTKKQKIKKCKVFLVPIPDSSRLKTKTRAPVHDDPNPINGHFHPALPGGIPECRATL
jgi:hypothetical protein